MLIKYITLKNIKERKKKKKKTLIDPWDRDRPHSHGNWRLCSSLIQYRTSRTHACKNIPRVYIYIQMSGKKKKSNNKGINKNYTEKGELC